ncbi:hypothetical protein BSLG_008881 [Batrachochytrium salamandrivorans]|nr:hypothetical protein BSLG_008881 [Batrachochytrium salamandrivorans]
MVLFPSTRNAFDYEYPFHDAPQSANKENKIEHLDDDVSKTSVIHKVETSLSPIKSAAAELSPPIGDVKGKSAEKLLDEPIKESILLLLARLTKPYIWSNSGEKCSRIGQGDPTTFSYIDQLRMQVACLEEQVHKLSKECTGADANATNQLEMMKDYVLLYLAPSAWRYWLYHIIQCGQCQLGHSYCFHCLREWCSQQTDTRRTKCPTCETILSTPPVSSSVLDALVDMALDRLPMSERETQRARIDVHKESQQSSGPSDSFAVSVLGRFWVASVLDAARCSTSLSIVKLIKLVVLPESESGEIGTPAETQDPSSLECPLASFPDGDSNDGPLAVLFSDSGSSVYDEGDGFIVDDEGDVSVGDSCSETFNDDLELTSEANSVAQVESPLPNNQSALVKEESKDESSDDELK